MTFGERLHSLMAERRISQRKLAALVPCNSGYLSKLAADLKRPSLDLAERLDELLGAGGSLAAHCPADPPPPGEPLDLASVHIPAATGRPADVDYVEQVRQTSQALVRLDTEHGGDDVLPLALRSFRAVNQRLGSGSYESSVERDLMAAAGEAAEVAAWLAYDADRQDVSRQVIHEALMLSRQAGDSQMELFEWTHLAMQSVHLHRPAEALRISTGLLDDGLQPRAAALMDIRRGRALAQLGHRGQAIDTLDRARVTLAADTGGRDAAWTWWVTDAEVLWHTGMAHAELGEWGTAVPLLREAAELRSRYRRARYNDLAHLLNALAHVADWAEVEPVLTEVAGDAGDVGSGRTTNLLRRVTGRILRVDAPSRVSDLAEKVHHVLNAA
ncbi:helix-turn-helix domain-containing protein [Actinomadura syzygii]|uniref:Helix-turn-helix domain-containing protein n=1 Tax=Actinomadura syzygii TaxID=1427538 RepID=A0A5D0U5S7_9ACTN|nr:helix-turn-helix transcriptional regulator [Actinomadura syzygii]TYC13095.1 helix-turn-helix domain-containing protein [Actinomadura syzygii]